VPRHRRVRLAWFVRRCPIRAPFLILLLTSSGFAQRPGSASKQAAPPQPPGIQLQFMTIPDLPPSYPGCYEIEQSDIQFLQALKSGHPIGRMTATRISAVYFEHIFGLCGAMSPVKETKQYWHCKAFAGIGPTPVGSIVIEKATGSVSGQGQECFSSIPAFLKHLLTPSSTRTPPALPSALSQHPASSAPLSASAQAGPVSFIR